MRGRGAASVLREELFDPLGMPDTGFHVPEAQSHRLPAAYRHGDAGPEEVEPEVKPPESFYPGSWDGTGWGYGVATVTAGPARGRFGWSGGLGTNLFVDPGGTIGILLTQVEMGGRIMALRGPFQTLAPARKRGGEPHRSTRGILFAVCANLRVLSRR